MPSHQPHMCVANLRGHRIYEIRKRRNEYRYEVNKIILLFKNNNTFSSIKYTNMLLSKKNKTVKSKCRFNL